jgi:hypothetical protein
LVKTKVNRPKGLFLGSPTGQEDEMWGRRTVQVVRSRRTTEMLVMMSTLHCRVARIQWMEAVSGRRLV